MIYYREMYALSSSQIDSSHEHEFTNHIDFYFLAFFFNFAYPVVSYTLNDFHKNSVYSFTVYVESTLFCF